MHRHSLGWVCARKDDRLIGFANVAWDGGVHAFVLDTMVAHDMRKTGVGTELVTAAARGARAADREWLHADFEEHLRPFYFDACGFRPTDAGLLTLRWIARALLSRGAARSAAHWSITMVAERIDRSAGW